ncbi:terminase large subunit [Paraburkholderia aspalathi]|nr:terminase large subunit [Paraburkholderia aspalathi]
MSKSAFPDWIYDGSPIADPLGYGQDAVDFLKALKHPASTAPNNRFELHDWQERLVRAIYGPRRADGSRIVRNVFLMLPRGNRKTSLAAALALLHTIGPEARPAGQAIFAASDREQASIGFKEAANIVRQDKRLVAATRIYDAHNSAKKILYKGNAAELQAVSSDGAAQHGKTPSFVLVDEIHAWKGRDLWEALKSGMAKVNDTLMIIATTAGRGQENIGYELYDYARKVATGEIIDPAFLPIIFEADPGDDWQDEATWHRVNPGLKHGFPNLDGLRTIATEAAHRPAERFAFQQFHLNVWMSASRDPIFDMTIYDQGINPHFDLADLEALPCYLGVDMSVNGDLTAVVAAWRHDDGAISVCPWFFVPDDDLQGRGEKDGVPYVQWRDDDLINAIPGPVIEPQAVENQIREICARFNVQEVAFDPHLARMTMQRLYDEGIPTIEFRQGPLSMAPAIGTLERVVNGRNIRHSGHPVLRHHFDSVVASRNDTGLVRMHKGKKTDRIDGAVAAAMAVSRAVAGEQNGSFLDTADFDDLWNGE